MKHLELKIKQLESRVEKLEFNQMKRTDQPISKELDSFYDKNETINCAGGYMHFNFNNP